MGKFKQFITENSIGDVINKKIILDELPVDKKYKFVVIPINKKRSKEDKFFMAILDKNNKIIIPLGSHPSRSGAVDGFYKNKIKNKTLDELKKDFKHMLIHHK